MDIVRNKSLRELNSFGVECLASHYTVVTSEDELRQALQWAEKQALRSLLLGGGSNLVLAPRLEALLIQVKIKGITETGQSGTRHRICAAAGEVWGDVVAWALDKGYGGIENLCLIPGTAGAAPIQNIGAYGVEFKDCCHSVRAMHRQSGKIREFAREACCFGYRDSFFKQHAEEWAVLAVTLELDEKAPLHTNYAALQQELAAIAAPDYRVVAQAVEALRLSKLPDPKELGNAGSFFKNPVVPLEDALRLQERYPAMPFFRQGDGTAKLSAAWLLDEGGWKGLREGAVGCYARQPLVLVNYGGADGNDILGFAGRIQADISQRFGILLEREPVAYA